MKTILIFLTLCLSACDPQFTLSIDLPAIDLPDIDLPVPCLLAPGDCARTDEEFAETFDAMSDTEQAAYVEQWAAPRSGFVSLSAISGIYGTY